MFALLLAGQTAHAAPITVTVDGKALSGEALVVDGTTYVPLVPLLEALGGWETTWDQLTATATAVTGLFRLDVLTRDNRILIDGYAFDTGADVFVHDGRTYVPLRAAANLLGAGVEWAGWDVPIAVSTVPAAEYTEEDLYWLSHIISAESQGEPLLGQIAVGNVVLNRLASELYPDTIEEVIFDVQDEVIQFEPVGNGTVYNPPTEQSVLAARMSLNGTDVAGPCKFFFAPALSPGTWIRENCTYYMTIGCHEFYQ